MPSNGEIIAAMDADADGRKLAEIVRKAVEMTGRSDLRFLAQEPEGFKDWNDQLAREAPALPALRPEGSGARLRRTTLTLCCRGSRSGDPTEVDMAVQFESEAFVTPDEAAAFLRCSPITVKRLAREGKIPAHSITNGVRKRWRFLISELADAMQTEVSLKHHPRRLQGGSGK